MTKFSLLLTLILLFSTNGFAAIMGLLYEDDMTKLEVTTNDPKSEQVTLSITGRQEIPTLYITRYMPGAGGNVAAFLEALGAGRLPPQQQIAEWMPVTNGEVRVKIGVYSENVMTYASPFTGGLVEIQHIASQRVTTDKLADGRIKQTFRFSLQSALTADEWKSFKDGALDVELVTQAVKKPGDFDVTLKPAVHLTRKDAVVGNQPGLKTCEGIFGAH